MASAVASIREALESSIALAQSLEIVESERVELLKAANKLVRALEKPEDALYKLAYSPSQYVATRVCLDMKIFEAIVEKGTVTSAELADASGADRVLIERLLRVLTASGYVLETAVSTYASNALTKAASSRTTRGMLEAIYDVGLKSLISLPAYLRETNHRNPTDNSNGPFQYVNGVKDMNVFQWLVDHPQEANAMQTFFEGDRGSRPDWVDWFPVQEKLLSLTDTKDDTIVLVDVAGGRGHEISSFLRKFPHQPGRYVLQDLPEVINDETLTLDKRIEKKAFDFWNDSPVSGARIYYLKFIMHDWSDEKCIQILKNVAAAMTPGFSFLVIEDFILPDSGCPELAAMWDMQMIAFLAGMERTRSQWRGLMEAAGFDIEGFYPPPGDGTGITITELRR